LLPANAASSWQTNGTVRAIAHANGVVYLGGDFTSVTTTASQPVIFSDTWAGADGSAWAASKCTTTSSAGVADTSGGA
jgi:hypothetical protein